MNYRITKAKFWAWLKQQPADRKFYYQNTEGCMIYHYLAESNVPVRRVGGDYYRLLGDYTEYPLPKWLHSLAGKLPGIFTVKEVIPVMRKVMR